MLDSNSELDETRDVKARIAVSLQQLKAFHLTISAVMIDLAALRQTILTTPAMKSRYKKNLARAAKRTRPLVREAMQSYDDLIDSTIEDETAAGNPSLAGMNIH